MNAPFPVAFLLFAAAWGANHFVPLMQAYRGRLGLSPTDLAQVFGIYAVGLLPGLLFGGPLSDRLGRRRVVLPAAVIALLGTAILGAGLPTLFRLGLGRFVVGLGSGATFSAATAWVQDLALGVARPGTGARRAATALSAGFGGGPLVAGILAQWLPYPLVVPYVVQAVVLVAAIVLVARLPATPRPARAPATASASAFVPPGFVAQVVPVAPWVFGLASISFAVLPSAIRARLGGWVVIYAGLVTATTLFCGLLVQTPLRTRSARAAGRWGLGLGLCGLLVAAGAAQVASPLVVLAAAAVLGAGYGACLVAGLRFVEERAAPGARGRVTGLFYVLTYLGFTAPLLLEAAARRVGHAGAILLAAGVLAVSLLWRLGGELRRAAPDGRPP